MEYELMRRKDTQRLTMDILDSRLPIPNDSNYVCKFSQPAIYDSLVISSLQLMNMNLTKTALLPVL
ncbi:hypothetical protein N7491_001935 [Penicillium cf. griseofulvum]|uniref:Uncharacterized protein n=1 Tax=Penicillium cf. griseofulvum TaxID=2972120 RepID=A0A9W9MU60_9EURO|nr:hypothetical protein N7472_003883 [Penicillium cf. griseofulvum]KAJ5445853.1 hypothetical protein N7491_001935 [Penicillium cf. griseofulvum]KAJ5447573.1 hypothetical protein N7445_002394 [Penicillium cf. griseofulvum]